MWESIEKRPTHSNNYESVSDKYIVLVLMKINAFFFMLLVLLYAAFRRKNIQKLMKIKPNNRHSLYKIH